jgi:hypothetical protein
MRAPAVANLVGLNIRTQHETGKRAKVKNSCKKQPTEILLKELSVGAAREHKMLLAEVEVWRQLLFCLLGRYHRVLDQFPRRGGREIAVYDTVDHNSPGRGFS